MFLIAETAWHHDGDICFFKKLVTEICCETNVDYVKFHITLSLDEYMHSDHPAYNWAKERMFSEEQWDEILSIPKLYGKRIILLFNDKKAIDFGMAYKPELVEIHSVCLNDYNLLEHLKRSVLNNTKIILGIGGTDLYEIENAISTLGTGNIVLMHGFQNYPTKYEDINLGKIKKIMNLYPNFEHGYADHTAWDNDNNMLITLFGAAVGMQFIEKHVTICPGEKRTDWQAAISIELCNKLLDKLDLLDKINGNGLLKMNAGEKAYSVFGANKKAAILSKDVAMGDTFTYECFSFKRTGQNSDLSQLEIVSLIGNKFKANLYLGHCILRNDLV